MYLGVILEQKPDIRESGAADTKLQDGNVVSTLIAIYMRDLDGSSCEGRRTHDEGILRCATCKIKRHQQGQTTIPPMPNWPVGASAAASGAPLSQAFASPVTYLRPASGSPDRP